MSTLNDTDLFVIERSGTNYQVRSDEMSTLNDTDLLVVERAGVQYKIEATDLDLVPPGVIESPVEVLTPLNGAGLNAGTPYQPLSTAITAVGAGGEVTYTTDTISNVAGNVLTFPSATGFDKFEVGDAVGGVVNPVRNYSDSLIPSALNAGSAAALFNGNPGYGEAYSPNGIVTTSSQAFVFNPPIAWEGGSVNCIGYGQININFSIFIDNVEHFVPLTNTAGGAADNIANNLPAGNITAFGVPVNTVGYNQIELNGKALVDGTAYSSSASITAIDAAGPTITTDGGEWYGADGTGDASGDTNITKTVTSDVTLTFTDDTELANMVGPLTMVNENGVDQGVSAADVDFLSGSILGVSNVTGTWVPGLFARGAEVTASAPSPGSIVFTSSNGGTTAFTGTDTTLISRTWTLESGNSATGPWTVVGEYEDTSATASQDGSVNWTGHPALEANKYYQIKVKYNASSADAVESTFNTFKTGDE